MIAVIFELWPSADQQATYFDLAAQLRPDLDSIDGFISIER
jgi:heme-degrading monooxygenase HmoA